MHCVVAFENIMLIVKPWTDSQKKIPTYVNFLTFTILKKYF